MKKQKDAMKTKLSPVITIGVTFNSENNYYSEKVYSYKAFRDMNIVKGDLVVVRTSTSEKPKIVDVVSVDTHSEKAKSFILDVVGEQKMEERIARYEMLQSKKQEIKEKKMQIIEAEMMKDIAIKHPELANDVKEYEDMKKEFGL